MATDLSIHHRGGWGSHDGATTTDFRTFSDPVKYRASKDAEITIERTRNPYASAYEVLRTDDDQQWSYVGSLTDILGNGRYSWMYLEGPGLFRYNDADVKTINGRKMRFGLMCDQYAEAKG